MSKRFEDGDGFESARGLVHVCLTFEINGTTDDPEKIGDEVINYIDESLSKVAFPYEGMSLQHVEIEGDELDYADWGYEDYVNYKEDTTEK